MLTANGFNYYSKAKPHLMMIGKNDAANVRMSRCSFGYDEIRDRQGPYEYSWICFTVSEPLNDCQFGVPMQMCSLIRLSNSFASFSLSAKFSAALFTTLFPLNYLCLFFVKQIDEKAYLSKYICQRNIMSRASCWRMSDMSTLSKHLQCPEGNFRDLAKYLYSRSASNSESIEACPSIRFSAYATEQYLR